MKRGRPGRGCEAGELATIPLTEQERFDVLTCARVLHPEHVPERVYILMALRYALRTSEAQALTFRHVSGRVLFVAGKKRGNSYKYEMDDSLLAHLSALRAFYAAKGCAIRPETPLFLSQKGRNSKKPMTTVHLNRFLAHVKAEINLQEPLSTHTLRKTAITDFQAVVQDPFVTQELSRHQSILSLMPYVKAKKFKDTFTKYLNTLE